MNDQFAAVTNISYSTNLVIIIFKSKQDLVKLLSIPKASRQVSDNVAIRDLFITSEHPLQKTYSFRMEGFLNICANASLFSIDAHRLIYQQMDQTEKLYVIISGSVGIYFPLNHEKIYENYRAGFSEDSKKYGVEDYKRVLKHIRRLEKDEWFGEVGLLNHGPIQQIAISESYVDLMLIDQKDYQTYFYEKVQNILYTKLQIFNSNMFQDCTDSLKRVMVYLSHKVNVLHKQAILQENQPSEDIFIIKKGEFGIYKRIQEEDTTVGSQKSSQSDQSPLYVTSKQKKDTKKQSKNTMLKVIQQNEVVGEIDALGGTDSVYSCLCQSYEGGQAIAIPKVVFLYVATIDREFQSFLNQYLKNKTKELNDSVSKMQLQMQRFGEFFFFKNKTPLAETICRPQRLFEIDEQTKLIKPVAAKNDQQKQSLMQVVGKEELKQMVDTMKEAETKVRETEIKDDMNYFPIKKNFLHKINLQHTFSISSKNFSSNLMFQQRDNELTSPQTVRNSSRNILSDGQVDSPEKSLNRSHSESFQKILASYGEGGTPVKSVYGQTKNEEEGSSRSITLDSKNNTENSQKLIDQNTKQEYEDMRKSTSSGSLNKKQPIHQEERTEKKELRSQLSTFAVAKKAEQKFQNDHRSKSQPLQRTAVPEPNLTERLVLSDEGLEDKGEVSVEELLLSQLNKTTERVDKNKSRLQQSQGSLTDKLNECQKSLKYLDMPAQTNKTKSNNVMYGRSKSQSKGLIRRTSSESLTLNQTEFAQISERVNGDQSDQYRSTKSKITDKLLVKAIINSQNLKKEVLKNKELFSVGDLKAQNPFKLKSIMEVQNYQRRMNEKHDPMKYDDRLKNIQMRVLDLNIQLKKQKNKDNLDQEHIQKEKEYNNINEEQKEQIIRNHINRVVRPSVSQLTSPINSSVLIQDNLQQKKQSYEIQINKIGSNVFLFTPKNSSFSSKAKLDSEKSIENAQPQLAKINIKYENNLENNPSLTVFKEELVLNDQSPIQIIPEKQFTSKKDDFFQAASSQLACPIVNLDGETGKRKSIINYSDYTFTQQSSTPKALHRTSRSLVPSKGSPQNSNNFQTESTSHYQPSDTNQQFEDQCLKAEQKPKKIHFKNSVEEYLEMKAHALANNFDKKKIKSNDIPFLDSYANQLQINLKRLFYVKLKDKYGKEGSIEKMQERIAEQMLDQNSKAFLQNNKDIMPDKIETNYLYNWRKHADSASRRDSLVHTQHNGQQSDSKVHDFLKEFIPAQGLSQKKQKLPQLYENHKQQHSLETSQLNNSSSFNLNAHLLLKNNSNSSDVQMLQTGGRDQILNHRASQFSTNMLNIQRRNNQRQIPMLDDQTQNQLLQKRLRISPVQNPQLSLKGIEDTNVSSPFSKSLKNQKSNSLSCLMPLATYQPSKTQFFSSSSKQPIELFRTNNQIIKGTSMEGLEDNSINKEDQTKTSLQKFKVTKSQFSQSCEPRSPFQRQEQLKNKSNLSNQMPFSVEDEMKELTNSIISKYGLKSKFKKKELL